MGILQSESALPEVCGFEEGDPLPQLVELTLLHGRPLEAEQARLLQGVHPAVQRVVISHYLERKGVLVVRVCLVEEGSRDSCRGVILKSSVYVKSILLYF